MAHDWEDNPLRQDYARADALWRWKCRKCGRPCPNRSRTDPPKADARLPGSVPGIGVVFWTCEEFVLHEVHAS